MCKCVKTNMVNMNLMDYGLKKMNEMDHGLKEMHETDYGLKEINEKDIDWSQGNLCNKNNVIRC